jgi:hypothetical protein
LQLRSFALSTDVPSEAEPFALTTIGKEKAIGGMPAGAAQPAAAVAVVGPHEEAVEAHRAAIEVAHRAAARGGQPNPRNINELADFTGSLA